MKSSETEQKLYKVLLVKMGVNWLNPFQTVSIGSMMAGGLMYDLPNGQDCCWVNQAEGQVVVPHREGPSACPCLG